MTFYRFPELDVEAAERVTRITPIEAKNDETQFTLAPPGRVQEGCKKGEISASHDRKNKEQETKNKGDLAQEIFEIWNQHCGDSLPKVNKLSAIRRGKLATRFSEAESPESYVADFTQAVKLCAASPFLSGQNDRRWTADFDWLIKNDGNLVKVLEGKYSKPNRTSGSPAKRDDPKAKLAEQLHAMGVPDSAIQGVAV
jgi:hypothetical protein